MPRATRPCSRRRPRWWPRNSADRDQDHDQGRCSSSVGNFEPVPTARIRHAVIGVLMASVCGAAAALGALGATGRVVLVWDRVVGRAVAIVEEMPGAETGPPCPLD